jgi:hypothetical protein
MKVEYNWSKISPKPDDKHGAPCERSSHGLSILKNGKLLILHGGEQIARTPLKGSQSTWAALNENGVWSWKLIQSSSCPPSRVAHSQSVHQDSVYIFGGRQGIAMEEAALQDLWKLDCSGDTFVWQKIEPKGQIPEARSFHKMLCVGSSLYVFGGCGASGRLADLHRYDIVSNTWHTLPVSNLLRGRGGANFMTFDSSKYLGVVAGFCGEESNDGHLFDIEKGSWQEKDINNELDGLRPRSVCISESFPSIGVSLIFGGEVDPSEKGHEGAGGFENDLVFLDEDSAKYQVSHPAPSNESWPETRGWSDGASLDNGDGSGKLYIYGGLSGDDSAPKRLNDLWCLDVKKP